MHSLFVVLCCMTSLATAFSAYFLQKDGCSRTTFCLETLLRWLFAIVLLPAVFALFMPDQKLPPGTFWTILLFGAFYLSFWLGRRIAVLSAKKQNYAPKRNSSDPNKS